MGETALSTANVSDEILRALRRIIRKISEHSRQLSRDAGLTVPQLLCLRAIGDADPQAEVTVASVSAAVQLSPATVSRILDRMENSGLIVRERRSDDRRKVGLSLTDAGRQKAENVPTPLQEQFSQRLQALPDHEQAQLLGTLQKIVEMMEAADLDAAPLLDSQFDPKSHSG